MSLVVVNSSDTEQGLKITKDLLRRAFAFSEPACDSTSQEDRATDVQYAAVAAVCCEQDPIRLLLIRRAKSAGDPWSEHMALPGGKRDAHDRDLQATALRETREELGIDLETAADFLGALPPEKLARQRPLEIHPFVFAVSSLPALAPNHEVDGVSWVTLESLLDGSRDSTLLYPHAGQRFHFPAWSVGDNRVWGLTYRMIQSLLQLLVRHA